MSSALSQVAPARPGAPSLQAPARRRGVAVARWSSPAPSSPRSSDRSSCRPLPYQHLMTGITRPAPGTGSAPTTSAATCCSCSSSAPGPRCSARLVVPRLLALGHLVGLPAGCPAAGVDRPAMRWADLMFSLPALLVAIVVTGVLGGGYGLAIAVMVVLFSPGDSRVVRAAVLEQRHRPYVEAATLSNLARPHHRAAPHLAQHRPGRDRQRLPQLRLRAGRAVVAVLPRPRRRARVGRLGPHARGEPQLPRLQPVGRGRPGLAIILTAASVSIVGDWVHQRLDERGRAR